MMKGADIWRAMGQMAEPTPSLATVLLAWMRRERLTKKQVADAAGLSRAHLWLIAEGRVARPTPETLRKLARAVATDPYDGSVDTLKRDTALRELATAAGYDDLTETVEQSELAQHIRTVVGNPQVADFYAELILENPAPNPAQQHLMRAVIALHGRPGGGDVMGWLMTLNGNELPPLDELLRRLKAIPPPVLP